MKKNLIALAVASAFAAPIAMADAPVVYGLFNVNAGVEDGKDLKIGSTASRLGVKGSEDLGNGLKAVYMVEFGVDLASKQYNNTTTKTESTQTTLTNRNSYLGLAGGFGTVLMGRHDTPEKMSQASDLFNDGAADLDNIRMTSGVETNEEREDNVLAYVSPSFSGVKLIAATIANSDNNKGGMSAALTYGSAKNGVYLAAATTDFKDNSADPDTTRVSAQYKANGMTANVILMNATNSADTSDNGSVTQANLGYKIGKFMPKLKVSMANPKDTDSSTNIAYGLNYSLGKKTTAYIYSVVADKKNTAVNSTATNASYIGMVHKF